jgi:hypothetical protein
VQHLAVIRLGQPRRTRRGMDNHNSADADPHLVSRLFGRVQAINIERRAADTFNIHCEISAIAYILETGSTDAERFEREELQPGISAEAEFAISIAAGTLARLAAKDVVCKAYDAAWRLAREAHSRSVGMGSKR